MQDDMMSLTASRWEIHFVQHYSLTHAQLSQGVQTTTFSLVNHCGCTPPHSDPLADVQLSQGEGTAVATQYVPMSNTNGAH